MERATYSAAEVAELLGVSEWLVYEMAKDGRLPTLPTGRRVRVPKVALERMLADPKAVA